MSIEVCRLWTRETRYTARSRSLLIGALFIALFVGLVLFLLGYEVALVTVPVAAFAVCLVLSPGMPVTRRFLWLTASVSMMLGLAVEIVVLRGDIGRMNTVFKFYLQAWVLLAIVAGVSLAWVRERARRRQPGPCPEPVEGVCPEPVEGVCPEPVEGWRKLWWVGVGALIFGAALFLPYGIHARAIDRMSPQTGLTLDGMAFMEHSVIWDGDPDRGGQEIRLAGDYAAIRWMQDNVRGSPVILEGLGHREYLWGNRVSIYTGLPTVVGWRWHQVQQRAALPDVMVSWRRDDVRECFNTTDVAYAQEILARYGVRYVYVGEYERAYYNPAGLAKFDQMAAQGLLRVVYDERGVKIYEVVR